MNPVSYNKSKRPIKGLFALSLAVSITWILYVKLRNIYLIEEIYTIEILVENPKSSTDFYTLPSMLEELAKLGIRNPKIVVCQMYHEATDPRNRGKLSRIGEGNKNPFGMKVNSRGYAINYPRDKNCTEKLPCVDCIHACYSTFTDAILDYKEWQAIRLNAYEAYYHKQVVTDEDYLEFLDNLVLGGKPGYRYAEDRLYTNTIRGVWIPRINRVLEYYKSREE